jgi:hypothetical protein
MKYALDIQKALYDEIKDMGYEVRDAFPSTIYPLFIVIGDDYGSQDNVKTQYASEIICNIHIYSTYNGSKEIKDTMTDIINILPSFEVSGYSVYTADVIYSSILPYISERTYREGLLQIRFKLL